MATPPQVLLRAEEPAGVCTRQEGTHPSPLPSSAQGLSQVTAKGKCPLPGSISQRSSCKASGGGAGSDWWRSATSYLSQV